MITLENDYLIVNVNSLGAELTGLFDKRDKVEHMWSADPKYWPRKAPILFPCVGESREGKITVNDVDYPIGRHGFARFQEFDVVEKSNDKVVLELMENEETLKSYPFPFCFQVGFYLEGVVLHQTFEVTNTGMEKMGFQIGGHPAFAVPFQANEAFSDYRVQFDRSMSISRHLLNDKGLYSGETREVLKNGESIDLCYDLFEEDALVFKDISSKQVWIQHKEGGKRLQVDYEGFLHLGIWSKPGADYVCIEPWVGCADNADQQAGLFEKDSIVKLNPDQTFSAKFSISVID